MLKSTLVISIAAFVFVACGDSGLPTSATSGSLSPPSPAFDILGTDDYRLIDLGTLGGPEAFVTGMNNQGHVVGRSSRVPNVSVHAFVWRDAERIDLGLLLPADGSVPADINESGQVAGTYRLNGTGHDFAFFWDPDAGMTTNPTQGRAFAMNDRGQIVGQFGVWDPNSALTSIPHSGIALNAYDINEKGEVVGEVVYEYSHSSLHEEARAFFWDAASGMQELTTPSGAYSFGGSYTSALGINEAGLVIGTTTDATGKLHAFYWTPADGMQDMGFLPGRDDSLIPLPTFFERTRHSYLNELGQVIGISGFVGFLWSETAGMVDLGPQTSCQYDCAEAINERGQVVGVTRTSEGRRGFVWENGARTFLQPPAGFLNSAAYAINDAGWIAGTIGWSSDDPETHAAIWRKLTPVELIDELIELVHDLASDDLNAGQVRGLVNHLNIATAMLNDGKVGPATASIEAFKNHVAGFAGSQLSVSTAQDLTGGADEILGTLD